MKRTIRLLALILTLTLALSAAAMAAKIDYDAGETNATGSVSAVSLVDKDCTLKFEGDKLKVTYTNANFNDGDMAVVFLLETRSEDGKLVEAVKTTEAAAKPIAPTIENIKYLDQGVAKATATNGSVTFDIYPQNHTSALVRIISVNKAGKLTDVNVAAVRRSYMLGDANRDGKVDLMDVSAVMMYVVYTEKEEYQNIDLLASNVNGDDRIDVMDVSAILMYAVKDVPFKSN